jgi:hypothetical protein
MSIPMDGNNGYRFTGSSTAIALSGPFQVSISLNYGDRYNTHLSRVAPGGFFAAVLILAAHLVLKALGAG